MLIALVNTMVFDLPLTYEEFAKRKLMQRLPKNHKRIDHLFIFIYSLFKVDKNIQSNFCLQ